jgi:hypothetical protein
VIQRLKQRPVAIIVMEKHPVMHDGFDRNAIVANDSWLEFYAIPLTDEGSGTADEAIHTGYLIFEDNKRTLFVSLECCSAAAGGPAQPFGSFGSRPAAGNTLGFRRARYSPLAVLIAERKLRSGQWFLRTNEIRTRYHLFVSST